MIKKKKESQKSLSGLWKTHVVDCVLITSITFCSEGHGEASAFAAGGEKESKTWLGGTPLWGEVAKKWKLHTRTPKLWLMGAPWFMSGK